MQSFLALDAGGTSTRAAVVDAAGQCLGYGRAGSGNPTSAGVAVAVEAVGQAVAQALRGRDPETHPVAHAVIAQAGGNTVSYREQLASRLSPLGVPSVFVEPDLLGIFHSGTSLSDGYAMVAGTGTAAARVVDGRLDRTVGGRGWLLGDAGGGFWIGHRVARAVVSALDGQGPPTALTEPFLRAAGIPAPKDSTADRIRAVQQVVSVLYGWRPVQLAQFAPLAFALPDDPVATAILVAASDALTDLLAAVRVPELAGPVVVGGSVLIHGFLTAPRALREQLVLPADLPSFVPVRDGVVGAAVLALRRGGTAVDADLFATLSAAIADRRRRLE